MSTLYTFWGTMIPYRTESVHFFGPINSATKHMEASDQLRSSCRVPGALAQCSRVLRGSMAQLGRQGTRSFRGGTGLEACRVSGGFRASRAVVI